MSPNRESKGMSTMFRRVPALPDCVVEHEPRPAPHTVFAVAAVRHAIPHFWLPPAAGHSSLGLPRREPDRLNCGAPMDADLSPTGDVRMLHHLLGL